MDGHHPSQQTQANYVKVGRSAYPGEKAPQIKTHKVTPPPLVKPAPSSADSGEKPTYLQHLDIVHSVHPNDSSEIV